MVDDVCFVFMYSVPVKAQSLPGTLMCDSFISLLKRDK